MRRNLSGRCQFIHASNETILDYLIQTKEIGVKMILLQFPTPYLLQEQARKEGERQEEEEETVKEKENKKSPQSKSAKKFNSSRSGFNERLPSSPDDSSFSANTTILDKMATLLNRHGNHLPHGIEKDEQEEGAFLLLQSNCEDVALYIHDSLLHNEIDNNNNLEAVDAISPRLSFEGVRLSCRTKTWLEQQHHDKNNNSHDVRRALGKQWSAKPILPISTETEASCDHQNTPIHRCLFKYI